MIYRDSSVPVNPAPKLLIENNGSSQFSGCLSAGDGLEEYRAGTDVVSSHYLDPNRILLDSELVEDEVYARVDMIDGVAFHCQTSGTGCAAPDGPSSGWNYPVVAVTYYVTACGLTGDDGVCGTTDDVPSLMRLRLWRDGELSRERVADGVYDMQVQYGADTDGDGLPDQYLDSDNSFRDATSWAAWSTMKSLRVWFLLRVPEHGHTDSASSYRYADVEVVPEADYRYELVTTTLEVRNQYSDKPGP
jgi:hypothetical protein